MTAYLEAFRAALSSLLAHRMRSFLTTLGILIGTASVIAVVSLIQGFSAFVTEQFAARIGRFENAVGYHHEQIAGLQQRREIAHATVAQRAGGGHMQQSRRIARPRRVRGNQFARQIEIEVGKLHERGSYSTGWDHASTAQRQAGRHIVAPMFIECSKPAA